MKRLILFMLALCFLYSADCFAQAGVKKTPELIKARRFTFYANTAVPQSSADIAAARNAFPGSTTTYLALNAAEHQLDLKMDTVISWLPYVGRSFSPNYQRDDWTLDFESVDFSYSEKKNKRGWTLEMTTKDTQYNQRLIFSISLNGSATLTISSPSRSTIRYSGYIDEIMPPKKKKKSDS